MKGSADAHQVSEGENYNRSVYPTTFFEKTRGLLTSNSQILGEMAEGGSIIQALVVIFFGSLIVRGSLFRNPFSSVLSVLLYGAMFFVVLLCLISPLTLAIAGIENKFKALKGYITLFGFSSIWFPVIIVLVRSLNRLISSLFPEDRPDVFHLTNGPLIFPITGIACLLVLKAPIVGLSQTSLGVSKSRWIILLPALLVVIFMGTVVYLYINYPNTPL